jgi:outer membrane immunogenic protein
MAGRSARAFERSRISRPAAVAAGLCFSFAAFGARADNLPLPAPFSSLGSLPTPYNWLLPNYRNLVAPYAWSGFFITPLIGYQTAQFQGNGGRLLRNAQGFTFGAEAGYNFQFGNFVIGPAADLSYSLMQGSANTFLANVTKDDISWVGTARAKVGYTFDRFMIYATGGFAFAETEVDGLFASNSQTEPGWTAGGGVQYLWSENQILRAEYRRLEIQNADFTALPLYQRKVGVAMNIFNAGFYFKF